MGAMGIGGYQYTGASCSPPYECPKVSGGDQHPVGEDSKNINHSLLGAGQEHEKDTAESSCECPLSRGEKDVVTVQGNQAERLHGHRHLCCSLRVFV